MPNHQIWRAAYLTSVIAAIGLAGCLATQPTITAAERPTLGRIGVTSVLGNEFRFVEIGVTVFGNKDMPSLVPDWKIDKLVEDTAVELLKSSGVTDVGRVPFADDAEASITGTKPVDKTALALAAAKRKGVDTLILVHYINSQNDPFLNSGNYGLFHRGKRLCLFSKFFVTVYSVKDGSERQGSFQSDCDQNASLVWRPSLAEFSGAEKEQIRLALNSQLIVQTNLAMEHIGLTGR